jgi:benzoyl-CoA reductase/2-hydroxyglutaryl-CoA dehydratase subunit BcrC/BadD/HgdB
MGRIGITTTIPVEIVYAAGHTPADLNNVFITKPNCYKLVEEAETFGFPRNLCAWIKGIFSSTFSNSRFDTVIGVTQGDCSNTQGLMEIIKLMGTPVIPFAFPSDRDEKALARELQKLRKALGASLSDVGETKKQLDQIRAQAQQIDELTWTKNKVSGEENHLALVSLSDFRGNYQKYGKELSELIDEIKKRPPFRDKVRLAFMGVPPIFTDLYGFIESLGARVVYNEIQHQYSMPEKTDDILEQYLRYTYPYGIYARLDFIKREVKKRALQGLIHYVQSFCYHQLEDLIVRRQMPEIPILTLEGDKPGPLDSRARLRIEAFIELVKGLS